MWKRESKNAHRKKHVAIVVQDGMKDHLIKMLNKHTDVLFSSYVISTKGTAEYMLEMLELEVDEKVPSGKDGGDTKIANMVVEGDVDILIFLLNPMRTFSHGASSSALVRECTVANIPIAINAATADILLNSLK